MTPIDGKVTGISIEGIVVSELLPGRFRVEATYRLLVGNAAGFMVGPCSAVHLETKPEVAEALGTLVAAIEQTLTEVMGVESVSTEYETPKGIL